MLTPNTKWLAGQMDNTFTRSKFQTLYTAACKFGKNNLSDILTSNRTLGIVVLAMQTIRGQGLVAAHDKAALGRPNKNNVLRQKAYDVAANKFHADRKGTPVQVQGDGAFVWSQKAFCKLHGKRKCSQCDKMRGTYGRHSTASVSHVGGGLDSSLTPSPSFSVVTPVCVAWWHRIWIILSDAVSHCTGLVVRCQKEQQCGNNAPTSIFLL